MHLQKAEPTSHLASSNAVKGGRATFVCHVSSVIMIICALTNRMSSDRPRVPGAVPSGREARLGTAVQTARAQSQDALLPGQPGPAVMLSASSLRAGER